MVLWQLLHPVISSPRLLTGLSEIITLAWPLLNGQIEIPSGLRPCLIYFPSKEEMNLVVFR